MSFSKQELPELTAVYHAQYITLGIAVLASIFGFMIASACFMVSALLDHIRYRFMSAGTVCITLDDKQEELDAKQKEELTKAFDNQAKANQALKYSCAAFWVGIIFLFV